MLNENFFCFSWVDIDATRNNHVAETIGDVHKAIGGDVTNFSESENAWAQVSLGRFFGVIWVHHTTTSGVFEKETTLGAGRQLIAVVVDNYATRKWRNHTTDRPLMCEPVFACNRTNRSYFGCAISIDKNRAEPFDHLLLHIDGASRTGVRHDFDA